MLTLYRYEGIRLFILLLLCSALGWQLAHPISGALCGITIFLSVHFYQLLRLAHLAHHRQRLKPPFPAGLWGQIYQRIALHQNRSRRRKRGLERFATRFREAAGAVPDALVILNKSLRVLWINSASEPLLGLTWPAVAGRFLPDLIGGSDLQTYLTLGDYYQPLEFIPPHNESLVLSLRVTSFGGKKRQRLLVARDITKIYHLDQIRRDFVANVSHELRTPLTVINGFVENLLDAPQTPEYLHHPLHRIHAQGQRMTAILHDLLTLSRLEMNDKASDQAPVDIAELIAQIVNEAATLSKHHCLIQDVDSQLYLLSHASDIRSAISNLIFNAIRHTPPGSTVHIHWRAHAGSPCFIVQDDGEGIAPEHVPRLTERFYRVDRGRSRASGGTGLGLAIVKHILQRHGAVLHIASMLGQGSIFTCRFPAELAILRTNIPMVINKG